MVQNPANAGDLRGLCSVPGSGRSPGVGMAIHSSILVCRFPWTKEPRRLQLMGLKELGVT